MRIIKKITIEETGNRIILVRNGQDLSGLIPDLKQRTYVKERLDRKKDMALLNQLDHQVIVKSLESVESPKYTRLENARKAAFGLHSSLNDHDMKSVLVLNGGVETEECIAFAEGLALTNYQFLKYYRGDKDSKYALNEILLHDDGLTDDQVKKLENLVEAVYLTRDLVNEPLSYLTAVQLSAEIEKMGNEAGFSVEVFNKKKIESLKMGGLLAVNKGSIDPPTFSILTWKPEGAVNSHPIVLVGKGVVL